MLGLRARQILALVAVMIAIATMSMVLEVTEVTRTAVDEARREIHYSSRVLVNQITQVVVSRPGLTPLDAVRDDPILQASLDAATQFAPTVLYAGFADSLGRAILHTDPSRVGEAVSPHPPLPELAGPVATWKFLWKLMRGSGVIHAERTPLRIGDTRFGEVYVALSPTFLRQRADRVLERGLYIGLIYILVATAAAIFLTRIVLGPLGAVRQGIEALRAGDFSYRIPQQNIQEFGRMAQALNELGAEFHERELTRVDTEHLRRAVELLGDGLLIVGPEREITLLNGLAAQFLQLDPTTAYGHRLDEVLAEHHPLNTLVDRLLSGRSEYISARAELPGGTEDQGVMALGHRIHGEAGALGALIELKDLSVLRDLQAVMDHSTVLSRLGEMAAGVAHEIRNPLNAITLHLEPLRQAHALTPEAAQEAVETVRLQIARLDRVVSGFLKVARLRKLTLVALEPQRITAEVTELLAPEATMAGLELVRACDEPVPRVSGDPEVLRQALMNVVKNAIQAVPSRELKIQVGCRTEEDRVLISVADSGPGMSKEVRDKAFDLYVTTKEHGTGVGLAFVLQAVEMHGGRVEIESEPGRGTKVTLVLRAETASITKGSPAATALTGAAPGDPS